MNSKFSRFTLVACAVLMLVLALPFAAFATPEEDTNKELASRWIEEFMLTGNLEVALELASPDFVAHRPHGQVLDLDGVRAIVNNILAGTRDRSYRVTAIMAEDSLVALQWTMRGTRTYERIDPWELNAFALFRMVDGEIAEMWYSINAVPQTAPT